jgi:hypothetical protein
MFRFCPLYVVFVLENTHRWASTSILMSAISDIDICYSDIGNKYVGLKLSFRYRKCSDIDIRVHSDIRHSQKNYFHQLDSDPRHLNYVASAIPFSNVTSPQLKGMSDIE